MEDKRVIELFNALEELRKEPDVLIAYHSYLKAIIDKEALLADAKNSGIEEGIEKGIKKGIEEGIEEGVKKVAKKMIAKGKSNEEIMDDTDLTVEQIELLRNKVN